MIAMILHPIRWLRLFFNAMLYGPDYSVYDAMADEFNRKLGIRPGDKLKAAGAAGAFGKAPGSKLRLLDDDGYSDKEDESYYGL